MSWHMPCGNSVAGRARGESRGVRLSTACRGVRAKRELAYFRHAQRSRSLRPRPDRFYGLARALVPGVFLFEEQENPLSLRGGQERKSSM